MNIGWETKPLGEVGIFQRGGNFLKSDFVADGFPCIHYGQIHTTFGISTNRHITCIPESLALSKARIARRGDLIIAITSEDVEGSCKSTAWLGDYDVAVGAHAAIYRHSLNPEYVSYFFKSPVFNKAKETYTHGFKVVEIRPSDIAKIPIPYPSFSEQQRIVDILNKEFAKIAVLKSNAEEVLNGIDLLFQATLQKEMTPSSNWHQELIGDRCQLVQGLAINAHTRHLIVDNSNLPLLRIKDMKEGTREIFIDEKNCPMSVRVCPDDIIYTRTGTLGLLFTGMYGVMHNNCFKIVLDKTVLDKSFFMYYVMQDRFRNRVLSLAKRAAQPDITHRLFKEQPLLFPSLDEQRRIVERLKGLERQISHLKANYSDTLSLCDDFKRAILTKAFNGEL